MAKNSTPPIVEIPETIPLLPLRNAVLFPGSIIPIDVGRKQSVRLIEDVLHRETPIIGIVTQRNSKTENPQEEDLFEIGTAARILKVIKLTKDNFSVIIQGIARIQILGFINREPFITCKIRPINEDNSIVDRSSLENAMNESGEVIDSKTEEGSIDDLTKIEIDALVQNVKAIAKKVIRLIPDVPDEATNLVDSVSDPGQLADLISANLELPLDEKQRILEIVDVVGRLKEILIYLNRQMAILKIREQINSQVQEEMGKSQREYVLRQHLKAIKEELGDFDDASVEIDEFKLKIIECKMPEDAATLANKQLSRLKLMSPSSAEYSVTHTFLDLLTELPWNDSTEDKLEIAEVRRILDEDHYGLEKVKKRIVEYLAVRKLNPNKKGPILCLVGPPGVGKTSLGKSIARAMGRKFWRISLGGVRDEAEIRGHRRTYVGAMPGRIIQGIKKTGKNNPVFMMDEIDKLGNDYRGDPSSALLEVLDPEQNSTFSDHYLEVHFDLSKVMFIATANRMDTIPAPLMDRMEILELPGYTTKEKLQIAQRFIIPRQIVDNGLASEMILFDEASIIKMIESYTREAGVRNLERTVEAVCRGVAVKYAEEIIELPAKIFPESLAEYLGPEKILEKLAVEPHEPGVATGLAWTPVGGEVLYIESRLMKGKGGMILTGQLGDVMKESVQAALSYIKSESKTFAIKDTLFTTKDIHLHVPAGGIPKDGPSAGITMFISLLSLFTQKRVRHDVAMTGEITLRGKVLPVGGIKEKSLAAHRVGIKRLILPERNRKDVEDIPQEARDEMEILFVSKVSQIPELVFVNQADTIKKPSKRKKPLKPKVSPKSK
jgi:ATP-dependent Lon protease